jgi:hypothetical protein
VLLNEEGIEAINALFQNIKILGDSFFEGDILSGPLELNSRNPSNIIDTKTWQAGTSTQPLHDYIKTISHTTPVNGLYGSIGFNYIGTRAIYKDWIECVLFDKDRVEIARFEITNNYFNYVYLQYTMQIGFFNPTGRTVKFNHLPLNEPTMQGAIWQDSQGYLRIKI